MIVYVITNKVNGRQYVGQTIRSVEERWKQHCASNSNCVLLRRAIKKYGKVRFTVKVLMQCDSLKQMNRKEMYYIRLFKSLSPNGYNLTSGGDSGGYQSKETRLKRSVAHRGKHLTEKLSEKYLSLK
jgi:group I intron endonuclease